MSILIDRLEIVYLFIFPWIFYPSCSFFLYFSEFKWTLREGVFLQSHIPKTFFQSILCNINQLMVYIWTVIRSFYCFCSVQSLMMLASVWLILLIFGLFWEFGLFIALYKNGATLWFCFWLVICHAVLASFDATISMPMTQLTRF